MGRCDIDPGFFVQAESLTPQDTGSWDCSNSTIDPDPASCQLGDFWEAPPLSEYRGNETVNGVVCGVWAYASVAVQARYLFWGTAEAPCATGQLATGSESELQWYIEFANFKVCLSPSTHPSSPSARAMHPRPACQ